MSYPYQNQYPNNGNQYYPPQYPQPQPGQYMSSVSTNQPQAPPTYQAPPPQYPQPNYALHGNPRAYFNNQNPQPYIQARPQPQQQPYGQQVPGPRSITSTAALPHQQQQQQQPPPPQRPSSGTQRPASGHHGPPPTAPRTPNPSLKASTHLTSSQPPQSAPAATDQPSSSFAPVAHRPTNYQTLLLSLAEHYVEAAHQLGPMAALPGNAEDLKRYRKLMATALGCFQAVLKTWKFAPRDEALVRLRYAVLLSEETVNQHEVEEVLSKGIQVCDRNKIYDLKYSMQHLVARELFKTNPRAALKTIDKILPEVEAEQHTPWVYAFSFLRVTLALQYPSQMEVSSTVQTLRNISNLAEDKADISVYTTCKALEALIHLRSTNLDNLLATREAIADARAKQLAIKGQDLSPVIAMLDMVDLATCLRSGDFGQLPEKLSNLHNSLDERLHASSSMQDNTFSVLIDQGAGGKLTTSTSGIFRRSSDGRDMLVFSWLARGDLSALGYFLSGITTFMKQSESFTKPEKYLREALKQMRLSRQDKTGQTSIPETEKRIGWQASLEWFIQLQLAFISCTHRDWHGAQKTLTHLKDTLSDVSTQNTELPLQFVTYLTGMTEQGLGNLDEALTIYQSPCLTLPDESKSRPGDPASDLRILSSIAQLFILQHPAHPHNSLCPILLAALQPLCKHHPNLNIRAAFGLVSAFATQPPSVVHSKDCIHKALIATKASGNAQLLAVLFTAMADRFFRGTAGDQSSKGAKSARITTARWGDPLWKCLGAHLACDDYVFRGKAVEAEAARREMAALLPGLPEGLKGGLLGHGVGG
ncbi:hypothetical protein EJ05DRAFT_513114 [Pseudovirgaria hyperparasitica]|uniref:75k gamma secalin n=1 Tax=Pseudovirgaria hyperparasitica TaxID=470096 RepID=A0A6A6W0K8_9PEZI|nr:uncharacterized protein EJ05DRAFT_513114 [Pseudovirgaria hyperparasitica]KAF2755626.1 hypothetical protein EJ05DRAFT_513114 [Pseudovirgaria hyperparasitica]